MLILLLPVSNMADGKLG